MYMDKFEYDKIMVNKSPEEILQHLMNIPRPNDFSDKIDYEFTENDWYDLNLAIKLIMDAYGLHVNYDKGIVMQDECKGDIMKSIEARKKAYWWLDKFPTKYNEKSRQMETVKRK